MSTQRPAIWLVICEMIEAVFEHKPETGRVLSRLFRRTRRDRGLRLAPLRRPPPYFGRADKLCELVFENGRCKGSKRSDYHIAHSTYLLGVTIDVLGRSIEPRGQAGYFRMDVTK